MLSHKNLILVFLILVLIITIFLCQREQFLENFEAKITNIYAKRYSERDNINESCDGNEELVLINEKDNMIYSKLCISKTNGGLNSNTKYVNNLTKVAANNINLVKNKDDGKKTNYIRSKSDYLGCYDASNLFEESGFPNPKTDTIFYGEGKKDLNYNTLEKIKGYHGGNKIFMSGVIRPEMNNNINSEIKSVGGAISNEQLDSLIQAGKRIPDKYCMGRVKMDGDEIQQYLGGIDSIAVYKNGTATTNDLQEPPIFLRDNNIYADESCMDDNINPQCIINFMDDVFCDYNMVGDFVCNDLGNFDTNNISSDKFSKLDNSIYDYYYKPENAGKGRHVLVDRSGNNNHMILDYNFLHFFGAFDLRHNFNNNLVDYKAAMEKSWSTDINTEEALKNINNPTLIFSRGKNKVITNKANYYKITYELNTHTKFRFEENDTTGLKYDSLVMRGHTHEWPYLGMINWHKDMKIIAGNKIDSSLVSNDRLQPNGDRRFNARQTFPKARSSDNDVNIGVKVPLGRSRSYYYENPNVALNNSYTIVENPVRTNKKNISEHNCICNHDDIYTRYDCYHLKALVESFMYQIDQKENPYPFYMSISRSDTRKGLLHYTKNKTNALTLRLVPAENNNNDTTKKYRNNKFFFRSSYKIQDVFKKQFMCNFVINNKNSVPNSTSIFHYQNQMKKVSLHLEGNNYNKYSGIIGNPIVSYSSNFRSKFDKNEIKPENKHYYQSFIWSYMKNYKNKRSGSPQDGLLMVRPVKIQSIAFIPNGGRLCVGNILIYDLYGNEKVFNEDNGFTIYKKNTYLSAENDSLLKRPKQGSNYTESENEKTYLFSQNPHSGIIKTSLNNQRNENNWTRHGNIGLKLRHYPNANGGDDKNVTANDPDCPLAEDDDIKYTGTGNSQNEDAANSEGFYIHPRTTNNDPGAHRNIGPAHFYASELNQDSISIKSEWTKVGDAEWLAAFHFYPKLKIPATPNDLYIVHFSQPIYVSRIKVECSIWDVITDHMYRKMPRSTDSTPFIDGTLNYHLNDNFDKVEMRIYNIEETAKLMRCCDSSTKKIDKKLIDKFNVLNYNPPPKQEVDTNVPAPSQSNESLLPFDVETNITHVDSIKFRSENVHHQSAEGWEAGVKNSVIDFHNVTLLKDPNQGNEEYKNVAIICQNDTETGNFKLYLKTATGSSLENISSIKKSSVIQIPKDYFNNINNKNFNLKIGNLFYSHNNIEMYKLTLFKDSFFTNKRRKYENGKRITDYNILMNGLIDDVILNKNNPYSTIQKNIKEKNLQSIENNNTNLFKLFQSNTSNFKEVNGSLFKYEKEGGNGYTNLSYSNPIDTSASADSPKKTVNVFDSSKHQYVINNFLHTNYLQP